MAIFEIKRAVKFMREGEVEEALPLLEEVTAQMPRYVTAHVLLARMYEAADRTGDALRTWEHAQFLLPNSPTILSGLRRVLRDYQPPASDDSASEEADQTSVQTAPQPPETLASTQAAAEMEAAGQDLDRLINDLETARIVPRPDVDDIPEPDLEDDIDDVVSETLARIYTSQGQFREAARVYEKLAELQPDRADEFGKKADEMHAKAEQQE